MNRVPSSSPPPARTFTWRLSLALASLLLAGITIARAQTTYYFDNNGATAGLGAGTATWDLSSLIWNSANTPTNTTPPIAWIQGSNADFRTGSGTPNTITLGTDLTIGTLTQTASGTTTTISGTNTLTLTNLTNTGAAFTINPNVILAGNSTFNITAATTLNGILSGAFGITKTGSGGTVTLTAANTFSGPLVINQGTVALSGANGTILNTSAITIAGTGANQSAILLLDNSNADNSNRVANSLPISLSTGAELRYQDLTTANSAETLGAVTLGAGQSTISNRASTSRAPVLTLASLARGTDAGLALIRGSNLGGAAAAARIVLSDGGTSLGTLVGTVQSSAGVSGTTTNLKIIPWMVGDTSATNQGGTFMTYDTTSGLRALVSNEFVQNGSLTSAATDSNYRLSNATQTDTVNRTLNSLAIVTSGSGTLTGAAGTSLTIGSGAILTSNTTSLLNGYDSVTLGNGEGVVFVTSSSGTFTVDSPINVTNSGGLSKGGAGTLTLTKNNEYTGPTRIQAGTLVLSSTVTDFTSNITTGRGGILTNNGVISGSVTANLSTSTSTVSLTNNGTLNGPLTIAAPTSGAALNLVNTVGTNVAGYAVLTGGSTTGAVTNNGRLDLTGSTAMTVGTISGSGATGAIYNSSTYNAGGGQVLTFAGGSSFAGFVPNGSNATTTLQQTGSGPVSFIGVGYNTTVAGAETSVTTFNGGTWNIGQFGQNNTNGQTIGTFTLDNGATVNVTTNGSYHFGTYNVTDGTMNFRVGIAQGNISTRSLNVTVNNSGGGSGALNVVGGVTLGNTTNVTANTSNSLSVGDGGTVRISSGDMNIGATITQTGSETVTNAVTLASGGKLVTSGALRSLTTTTTLTTNTFNWTGGQLTAAAISPSAGMNGAGSALSTTGLTNTGGILVPGDSGPSGRTQIGGNYTQGSSGTLQVDLAGTTAASAFISGFGTFDLVEVTGNASLDGSIGIGITPGFRPSASTFNVLTATGTLTGSGGSHFDPATPQTVATNEGFSTMTVTTDATNKRVQLGGYTVTNQWAASGNAWSNAAGAGAWTGSSAADPNSNTAGALFANTGGTVNLADNRTVRNVTFAPTTAAFTLASTGGNLTLDGGTGGPAVISNALLNNTISAPITLSSAVTAGSAASTNLTLSGNLSGSGALGITGAGTVTLSGNNSSYTGAVSVGDIAGNGSNPTTQLIITNSNALAGASSVTVNGAGASTNHGPRLTLGNSVTVSGKTLLMVPNSGRTTLYVASGNTGTWAGDVVVTSSGTPGLWADGSLTVGASSANVVSTPNAQLSLRGGNANAVINSAIDTGTAGIGKTDGGTWTINSTNNGFTGAAQIFGGVLSFSTIANSGVPSSIGAGSSILLGQNQATTNTGTLRFTGASGGGTDRSITISNGATGGNGVIENTVVGQTLTLSGNIAALTPASAANLTLQGAGNGVFSGGVTGSPILTLTKNGTGTWALSGANTYTGATTISNGNLQLGNGGATGSLSTSSAITNNATFTFNRSNAIVQGTDFSGSAISGTGAVVQAGSGSTTLNAANTYTGATTISAGKIVVTNAQALGSATQGTTVSSGASLELGPGLAYSIAEALILNGTGGSNGGALRGGTGSSSYAGPITAATHATIHSGGGNLTLTGGVAKDGTTLTFTGGGTVTVSGTGISGSSPNSDLIVDGTTAAIDVASTYDGPTFLINNGTLNANVPNALPTANGRTQVIMDQTGSGSSNLNLGASQSIASLTGAASSEVDLGAYILTIGSPSALATTTFAGVISGSGGLTKDGDSTQILSGANTYDGLTTVSDGTLLINGPQSGATGSVSVNLDATLGGTGSSGASAITLDGGTITGGTNGTAGTLTFDNPNASLTASTTSTWLVDLIGGMADVLYFSGASSSINLNNFNFLVGTDATPLYTGQYWDIAQASFITGAFSNLTGGGYTQDGRFSVSIQGDTIRLISAVPEPSTFLILPALLIGGLMAARRRKRVQPSLDPR